MKLSFLISATLLCMTLIAGVAATGKRRKIIIHVPVKVKQQKHTHTELKTVHHHHKPTVIKEEKIIKKEIHKPVVIKEEVEHEHFHHHYKHEHPTFEVDGHESTDSGNSFGELKFK
ncbi:uncharacterized protein LOC129778054 [Toxorhynchites rutilus septentrionalis]|uniref:uncharacterized protein LOC129778054 n=1 Tax=Toxorhynchites rutilus septentrionalis TaxID=329112 RepID=UPI0024788F6F|nr:uncharacterized protein LOC129778054 [Toxorhynchites rutilus septentrionalis]